MIITGFGDSNVNGTYTSGGTHDGQTLYVKNGAMVIYKSEYGPYSFSGAYYIVRIRQIDGAIPVEDPIYKIEGTNPALTTWKCLKSASSGVTTIGTVTP